VMEWIFFFLAHFFLLEIGCVLISRSSGDREAAFVSTNAGNFIISWLVTGLAAMFVKVVPDGYDSTVVNSFLEFGLYEVVFVGSIVAFFGLKYLAYLLFVKEREVKKSKKSKGSRGRR